ncbi:MAG: cysteine desulfurase [Rhodospirillales bacterium]|nr:cysteine desulfurase [Rhodospirillales bacterium]
MGAAACAEPGPGGPLTGPSPAFRPPRDDFPILSRPVNGQPLVWLDSAASAQKPRIVLDAMRTFAETHYANVHRGVHGLGHAATEAYEAARNRVAAFIGAAAADEVVFVRGATEAINLVAASFGRSTLRAGDEIVLTELEHHANIVPWQLLREASGVVLRVVPIGDDGTVSLDDLRATLGTRTRLVAVAHVSNVLGTVLPVAEIARLAHAAGARLLVDGCQAVPGRPVDVTALGADFYVFSAHKMYGPTGIGVLWGRRELLAAMPPWQGGGEMIASVSFERTTFKKPPYRFEAGTPPIIEAIGLAAACDYLAGLGLAGIAAHEQALRACAVERLRAVPGLRLLAAEGPGERAGILSFIIDGVHPHDIATVLDTAGIAIRAGHHCAQPLMRRLGVAATARASFGLYNTSADVDALAEGLMRVREVFG